MMGSLGTGHWTFFYNLPWIFHESSVNSSTFRQLFDSRQMYRHIHSAKKTKRKVRDSVVTDPHLCYNYQPKVLCLCNAQYIR